MAQWSANGSNNAGSPKWAHALVNKGANSTISATLFNNVSPNAFVNGQVTSIVAIDVNEVAASRAAHTGHHKRTVGSGGRAGRVHYECLVAGGITGDHAADDRYLPDTGAANVIIIEQEPLIGAANSGNNGNDPISFTVYARSYPSVPLTYAWRHGATGTNVTANSTYSGVDTATLVIANSAVVDGNVYNCNVSATGYTAVTSANVTVT